MTELEAAQQKVEQFTAEAQKSVQEGVEKLSKGMENAASFGQENLDAIVESTRIAAKAAESFNAGMIAYVKRSYEDGLAAAKDLSASGSLTEFLEKQNGYAKASVDAFVEEATRLTDLSTAAAKEALEPLNARMHASVDLVKRSRA